VQLSGWEAFLYTANSTVSVMTITQIVACETFKNHKNYLEEADQSYFPDNVPHARQYRIGVAGFHPGIEERLS